MKRRLPTVLSVTALVIAVAGVTPLGEAASDAIPRFARNADKSTGCMLRGRPRLAVCSRSTGRGSSPRPSYRLSR
jgi:hypothetical protein